MRIIGGHDYYDSALAYGHDETVVLVREKDKRIGGKEAERFGLRVPIPQRINCDYKNPYRADCSAIAVVIAGKLYPGVRFWVYDAPIRGAPRNELFDEFIWSYDRLKEAMETYGLKRTTSYRYWLDRGAEDYEDYFKPRMLSSDAFNYLVKERISILVTDQNPDGTRCWKVNPDCLKDIAFPRVMDPYTLFQELDMWVSGVLGMAGNPMIEVSNDTKIHKHGFDKMSFRKPKQA